jgi:hypothetical protein
MFTTVRAQTHADSIAKMDTTIKHPLVDTVKHSPDTVVKHPAVESAAKHIAPDTAKQTVVEIKHSPIKTLTDKQYNALLKGEDMDDMALVGEMNHYPLPDQALKYKVQIGLNPGQITKLKALSATLHRKKMEMGDNIIRNEKMLDSLFHSKQIIDGTLIFYTNRAGLYVGELRGAILMACYNTEQLLSEDQIKRLEAAEKAN